MCIGLFYRFAGCSLSHSLSLSFALEHDAQEHASRWNIFALEHGSRWNIFALGHIRAGPIRSQSFALEHAALDRFAVKNRHRKTNSLQIKKKMSCQLVC